MTKAIFMLFGVLAFTQVPSLEMAPIILIGLVIFATFTLYYLRQFRWHVILFSLGFIYAFAYYELRYSSIPASYFNTTVETTGVIEQVTHSDYKSTIIFNTHTPFQAKLRLNVYPSKDAPITLNVNDKWHFTIKLKTPNTYFNAHNFDYEKYLFSQRIQGVGYIQLNKPYKFITTTTHYPIAHIRTNIATRIDALAEHLTHSGILRAITIGDKSAITEATREVLQATNTTHLSVISGLHIGMIAGVGYVLAWLLFNYSAITSRIPFPIIASIVSLVFAGIYTLLAGLSLPTVRAFIMLGVFLFGVLSRRNYTRFQLFSVALIGVLLFNPFAVLTVSFYLSFLLVLVIIYYGEQFIRTSSLKEKLYYLFIMQGIISLFSGVLSMYFFGFISLGSILGNSLAIPLFSFVIVPFSLLGVFFIELGFAAIASMILSGVDWVFDILLICLSWLGNIPYSYIEFSLSHEWQLVLLAFGVFVSVLPRVLRLYPLGIVLVILVLAPPKAENYFSVLDVGQGASSVLMTSDGVVVFDTGDKFRSGFSLAQAVLFPLLRAHQINSLEMLIISHADRDHSGGKAEILEKFTPKSIIEADTCKEQTLRIGQIALHVLSSNQTFSGNNSSCVVQIKTPNISILIPGDIEQEAEAYLIQQYGKRLASEVLIVPHHGSKSSSSVEFLQAVQPKLALISSGYENRYRHPHPSVLKRYADLDIPVRMTACSGQIRLDLDTLAVTEERLTQAKFYHRKCKDYPTLSDNWLQ